MSNINLGMWARPARTLLEKKTTRFIGADKRRIATIPARDYHFALNASISMLAGMSDDDIASLVSTSVKYAGILRAGVLEHLLGKMKKLSVATEVAPGIIEGDGQLGAVGAILNKPAPNKTRRAALLDALPIRGTTIHYLPPHAKISDRVLVGDLSPSIGPLIAVEHPSWDYSSPLRITEIFRARKIKGMEKYYVTPCNNKLNGKMYSNSLRYKTCSMGKPKGPNTPSVDMIEKITTDYGCAFVYLAMPFTELDYEWVDNFLTRFSILCGNWPIRVVMYGGKEQSALLDTYNILHTRVYNWGALITQIEAYHRGFFSGYRIAGEKIKVFYSAIDTTAQHIADNTKLPLENLVFRTNHASSARPIIVVPSVEEVVIVARNPKAGAMFAQASPKKKIKANSPILGLPLNPATAFVH